MLLSQGVGLCLLFIVGQGIKGFKFLQFFCSCLSCLSLTTISAVIHCHYIGNLLLWWGPVEEGSISKSYVLISLLLDLRPLDVTFTSFPTFSPSFPTLHKTGKLRGTRSGSLSFHLCEISSGKVFSLETRSFYEKCTGLIST